MAKVSLMTIIVSLSIGFVIVFIALMKSIGYKNKKQIVKLYTRDQINMKKITLKQLSHYQIKTTHRSARTVRSQRTNLNNDGNNVSSYNVSHDHFDDNQNNIRRSTNRQPSIHLTRHEIQQQNQYQYQQQHQQNHAARSVRYVNSISRKVRSRNNVDGEE